MTESTTQPAQGPKQDNSSCSTGAPETKRDGSSCSTDKSAKTEAEKGSCSTTETKTGSCG